MLRPCAPIEGGQPALLWEALLRGVREAVVWWGREKWGRWSRRNHATLRGLLGELTESETEAGASARDGKCR